MCDFARDLCVPNVDLKAESVNGSATEERARERESESERERERERVDHATYHNPCIVEVFRLFSHQFGEGLPKRYE